jgi:polyketide cyclase/dehydrase/lipid transport protein
VPDRLPSRPIEVARVIEAQPADAFGYLRDLENHWRIAGRVVEVMSLSGPPGSRDGALLRVHGPCGLRRTVRTRITELNPPASIVGLAEAGGRTRARVSWHLEPAAEGTRVTLRIVVGEVAGADRLLLAVGGRRWLQRRLRFVLRALDQAPTGVLATAQAS